MAKAEQECPVYWIMGFSMPASQRGVRGKFLTFLRENPNVLTPALTDNDYVCALSYTTPSTAIDWEEFAKVYNSGNSLGRIILGRKSGSGWKIYELDQNTISSEFKSRKGNNLTDERLNIAEKTPSGTPTFNPKLLYPVPAAPANTTSKTSANGGSTTP